MSPAQIIQVLRERLQGPLPGRAAHDRMASAVRKSNVLPSASPEGARKAGVLLYLYPGLSGEWLLPLIRRPQYPGVHGGQMAFPGGRFEEQDTDMIDTALREAHEEVGIQARREEVLGCLTDLYIPPSNSVVTPVVAVGDKAPDFLTDPAEVDALFEIGLHELQDPGVVSQARITVMNGVVINAPAYLLHGQTIWGATAMIISELLMLLGEGAG